MYYIYIYYLCVCVAVILPYMECVLFYLNILLYALLSMYKPHTGFCVHVYLQCGYSMAVLNLNTDGKQVFASTCPRWCFCIYIYIHVTIATCFTERH